VKNRPFSVRLGFAIAGLRAAWHSERSLRTQAYLAAILLMVMLWLQPAALWWAAVGIMVTLVFAAELINTALEQLADHLHPEQHPKIKMVKDCAAGAVLILSIGSLWVTAWMLFDSLKGRI
jgi:diacylglycerol kinase (ATP)